MTSQEETLQTDLPHWVFFNYNPSIREVSTELSYFHKQPFYWKMIYLSKCSQENSIAWKTKFLMKGKKKKRKSLLFRNCSKHNYFFLIAFMEKKGNLVVRVVI